MRRSFVLAFCLSTRAALGAHAQLSVAMSADKTSIVAGNFVTYAILVTNNGPNAATNVRVSDVLTTLFSYVNFLGPGCSGHGEAVCTAPTIAAGASASFTVSIRYFLAGPLPNIATVTSDPAS